MLHPFARNLETSRVLEKVLEKVLERATATRVLKTARACSPAKTRVQHTPLIGS